MRSQLGHETSLKLLDPLQIQGVDERRLVREVVVIQSTNAHASFLANLLQRDPYHAIGPKPAQRRRRQTLARRRTSSRTA